ncbi:hypothetical protein LINPERPRIM_LOCUS14078 [Linum perenne]
MEIWPGNPWPLLMLPLYNPLKPESSAGRQGVGPVRSWDPQPPSITTPETE